MRKREREYCSNSTFLLPLRVVTRDSSVMTTPSLVNAFSENQISISRSPIMPQNEDPEQPQQQNPPPPTTLTLETEQPQNSDPPHHPMELDPNQDDVEMITPIPDNVIVTPSAPARRSGGAGKRKKQAQLKRRRAAFEKKSLRKLLALKETLKPIPFTLVVSKTLDFNRHESLLKRVGLWDLVHMEFDPHVRADLVAQLIANYNYGSRGSYVNGVRIGVNRADLARALRIPVRKDKSISVNAGGVSDGSGEVRVEKESEESIKIVEEIVSNWMFLHGDTWCLPEDVVNMTRPIKEGNLEKMDWAGLIWYMMEKELSAPKLENCYYATYMQCLIKSQKEELLREEVKVDLEEDCDGDVSMSDRVDDVKVIESEENSVELSLGQENAVDLKEGVENDSGEKEGMENVENEEKVGDEKVENEEKVGDEKVENEEKVGDEKVVKEGSENVEKDEKEIVEKNEKEIVEKDGKEIVEKDEKENVEKEEDGDLGKEETENVAKEETENVAKEGKEDVGSEGNEIVEEGEKEDVEKEQQEASVAEEVIKFEETENDEDNGQLFLDGSNLGEKEPFLRRCDLGEVDSMDFEEQKQTQEMEGEEEGGQGEDDDDDEEEEEEDEPEQEQEGAFLLSMGGETLEGVNSANLIQRMEAVSQVPFSSGLQIGDDDLPADFLGSRVDNNAIPGSSSHFGQNNKREMDHDNEVPHHSLNGSSKRMRTGGAWENKSSSEFDMCLDQFQHWMGKARIMYMEKEQACNELSMNQQLLLNELHKQEATIQHLHKVKFEEQQKRQREIYRLERELFIMTDLLDGYRKALKETRNAFADYRARFPQFDVPLYRDVPGGGGLMLTTMELEKRRLKQEEEERMNRLLIENRIKDFEAEYMAKFEAHRCVVESLNDRLLNIENQIEPLRELLAKQKVSDSSECAAPNE